MGTIQMGTIQSMGITIQSMGIVIQSMGIVIQSMGTTQSMGIIWNKGVMVR